MGRVAWQKFTNVSEVLAACISRAMREKSLAAYSSA
jgi:hypothetical protein